MDINEILEKSESISVKGTGLENAAIDAFANHSVDISIYLFTIFILATFVGYYVVWRVTPSLHTPLMAVTNAISGIIIIGAMVGAGTDTDPFILMIRLFACFLASINIFGGFIVTERMLSMFKKK